MPSDPCESCDGTGTVFDTTTGRERDCHDCLGTGRDR